MTNTSDSYGTNKTAFFQISFLNRGQIVSLSFRHQYNFGSNRDGGFLKISFDNGNSLVMQLSLIRLLFQEIKVKKVGFIIGTILWLPETQPIKIARIGKEQKKNERIVMLQKARFYSYSILL